MHFGYKIVPDCCDCDGFDQAAAFFTMVETC